MSGSKGQSNCPLPGSPPQADLRDSRYRYQLVVLQDLQANREMDSVCPGCASVLFGWQRAHRPRTLQVSLRVKRNLSYCFGVAGAGRQVVLNPGAVGARVLDSADQEPDAVKGRRRGRTRQLAASLFVPDRERLAVRPRVRTGRGRNNVKAPGLRPQSSKKGWLRGLHAKVNFEFRPGLPQKLYEAARFRRPRPQNQGFDLLLPGSLQKIIE